MTSRYISPVARAYRNPRLYPSIQHASEMLRQRVQPTLDARKAQEVLARTFERAA